MHNQLSDKNILVTGGTGSLGQQIVSTLLDFNLNSIVVFSRDEKKQFDMRNTFADRADILDFVIGDVRDYNKLSEAMDSIDIVYHAAALKQVPNCELNPFEATKTNVIGAENVRRAAIDKEVEAVVAISTDKAVKPVNVMGMTKALQERILLNPSNMKNRTRFICVRYGNVVGSRGSVIPFFKERIRNNKFLPVTSFEMTRFMLRLEEAIDLVLEATLEGETGQLIVRKMSACYTIDLARAMAEAITGNENYPIKEVGVRPGEKIHEVLVSEEELNRALETEKNFIIHPFGKLGVRPARGSLKEYSSDSTYILTKKEVTSLLRETGYL